VRRGGEGASNRSAMSEGQRVTSRESQWGVKKREGRTRTRHCSRIRGEDDVPESEAEKGPEKRLRDGSVRVINVSPAEEGKEGRRASKGEGEREEEKKRTGQRTRKSRS
jgi:hypothetical protein